MLTPKPEDTLMPREFEVARALAEFGADREFARALGLCERSAQKQLSAIMRKTGMEDRKSLAEWFASKFPTEEAREQGYISACLYLAHMLKHRRRNPGMRKLGHG